MIKSLYFGGSFNPIHTGHLICARAAANSAGFDRVVFLPAGQPYHRGEDAIVASAADRLAMVRLAIHGDPLFEVDDREIVRGGPTYTIDTVRQLPPPVSWLIGADTLERLATWHQADELFRLTEFVVMQRPGAIIDPTQVPPGCRIRIVETPAIDISATNIRQRVSVALSIDELTPPAVVRYIVEHGLYRASR